MSTSIGKEQQVRWVRPPTTSPVVLYGRKIVVGVIGTTVILFGLAIVVLPGPGPIIVVPLGIAILALEFQWAQRVRRQITDTLMTTAVEARARRWVSRRRTVRP